MKSYRQIFWLLTLSLLLVLAACGPAVSDEEMASAEATAAAQPAGEDNGHGAEADAGTEEHDAETGTDAEMTETDVEPGTDTETAVPVSNATIGYAETEAGSGPMPVNGDIYSIHIVLTLEDGTPVFNSYEQGQPITLILGTGQGLPGWEQGVVQMQAGGKAILTIPPELAFGPQGQPQLGVPGDAILMAEVELLDVTPSPAPRPIPEEEMEALADGFLVFDFVAGQGAQPALGDQVVFSFNMWENGTLVDSSTLYPEVPILQLGSQQFFPGFEDIVTAMQVGGERAVVFPAELTGGANLVMELTLVDVVESVTLDVPEIFETIAAADLVTTESGLQYYDIVAGTGATPEAGQVVGVHYAGWLQDGTPFDNSYQRGFPFEFPLGQGSVIAGWDEGLATMQVGGKRQLVIPADLAYGEQGSGATIPPGATLVFEVELLTIDGE